MALVPQEMSSNGLQDSELWPTLGAPIQDPSGWAVGPWRSYVFLPFPTFFIVFLGFFMVLELLAILLSDLVAEFVL